MNKYGWFIVAVIIWPFVAVLLRKVLGLEFPNDIAQIVYDSAIFLMGGITAAIVTS